MDSSLEILGKLPLSSQIPIFCYSRWLGRLAIHFNLSQWPLWQSLTLSIKFSSQGYGGTMHPLLQPFKLRWPCDCSGQWDVGWSNRCLSDICIMSQCASTRFSFATPTLQLPDSHLSKWKWFRWQLLISWALDGGQWEAVRGRACGIGGTHRMYRASCLESLRFWDCHYILS